MKPEDLRRIEQQVKEANAYLIAAAPDLLMALESIMEAGYLEGGYQPTIDMALEAIAKARGEA